MDFPPLDRPKGDCSCDTTPLLGFAVISFLQELQDEGLREVYEATAHSTGFTSDLRTIHDAQLLL
jgi:hypothetical protein